MKPWLLSMVNENFLWTHFCQYFQVISHTSPCLYDKTAELSPFTVGFCIPSFLQISARTPSSRVPPSPWCLMLTSAPLIYTSHSHLTDTLQDGVSLPPLQEVLLAFLRQGCCFWHCVQNLSMLFSFAWQLSVHPSVSLICLRASQRRRPEHLNTQAA